MTKRGIAIIQHMLPQLPLPIELDAVRGGHVMRQDDDVVLVFDNYMWSRLATKTTNPG